MATKLNPAIFYPSAGVITLFVLLGVALPDVMGYTFSVVQTLIVEQLGWFYTISVTFFLVFTIWLFFSSYGHIKLGKDDDEPDYSYLTWFSMLFSAGMGIGLLFYGVAEPVLHYSAPRVAEPGTIEAAREALQISFMHWGLHAWGIYIVIGLSLAYFAFRRDLPLTISSTLYPLLGRRIYGPAGYTVEILAIFGTLFGIATSLGLGSMQINAGLNYLGVIEASTTNQIILIIVITLMAAISVATGLDRGIRRLSEFNIIMAILLVLFVLLMGPTAFLLQSFPQAIGQYLQNLPQMSLQTDAFRGQDWQKSWTMFYWGWWISWSPFVGMFIARISRGRTIREFIGGVLLVPTLLTFIWMVVFGGTALNLELFMDTDFVTAVSADASIALFHLLDLMPLAALTSLIAVLIITLFFVTSSDSGSLVVGILSCGGDMDTPLALRLFWALSKGAIAIVLLLAGGLTALQTAAITTALPFCIIMLFICWSLVKGLRMDLRRYRMRTAAAEMTPALLATELDDESMSEQPGSSDQWRERLAGLLSRTEDKRAGVKLSPREHIAGFIQGTVIPAFVELRREMKKHGHDAIIERRQNQASLTVIRKEQEEFTYTVRGHGHYGFEVAFPELPRDSDHRYFTAATIVNGEVRRRYPMENITRNRIIEDFLEEYGRWVVG